MFLLDFVMVMILIVCIGILNEKFTKLPGEIALVLFSSILSLFLKIIPSNLNALFISDLSNFKFDQFLMEGILCFMLFAGSSSVKFSKFLYNLKSIAILAFLGTFISSALYSGMFFLLSYVLNLNIDIWICVLIGCILAPTDPITATSILKKVGLSKSAITTIEGESLFNDGIGVALFVCVRNIILNTSGLSFPVLISKELLGAIFVGFSVSFIMFKLLEHTSDPVKHILISILDVSLAYVICEHFGFSGAIASVVCGMYFAKVREKHERWISVVDPENHYDSFWHVADSILNNILFILIGVSIIYVENTANIFIMIVPIILINLLSRYIGVFSCSLFIKKDMLPSKYNVFEFSSLMTWSGLKGGLSLALAISCANFLPTNIYNIILITTYITIFFTIVFQGLSVGKVAKFIENHKEQRLFKN